jgi:putative restriction endonuclease
MGIILLLVPTLDVAFDRRLITFNEDGNILISSRLAKDDVALLGINSTMRVMLREHHQPYMAHHRALLVGA